jgi:hypothetical protein
MITLIALNNKRNFDLSFELDEEIMCFMHATINMLLRNFLMFIN